MFPGELFITVRNVCLIGNFKILTLCVEAVGSICVYSLKYPQSLCFALAASPSLSIYFTRQEIASPSGHRREIYELQRYELHGRPDAGTLNICWDEHGSYWIIALGLDHRLAQFAKPSQICPRLKTLYALMRYVVCKHGRTCEAFSFKKSNFGTLKFEDCENEN